MEDARLTNAMRIADRRSAATLRRQAICRLLIALARSPTTAAEAARAAGMPLNLACYHLQRLCALGLAAPAGERARAGRAAKLYRATASSFFIPAEFADRTWGDECARELRLLLEKDQREMAGELFFIDDAERMQVRKIEGGHMRSRTTEMWLSLSLDDKAAAQMIAELHALAQRYRDQARPGGRDFLIHAAVAPKDGG